MSNRGSSYIMSLFALLKLIISYLSSIRGGAIKAIREGTVIEGVSSIMCLEGTGSPRIKEAGIVVKRSFALKAAFLAFNVAMLAFIATSLLLILRRFLTKSATFAFKAASLTLA
jgi:hypothetical protein